MDYLLQLLKGGAGNLAAYLAAHVLLCLLPAFLLRAPWRHSYPRPASPAGWGATPRLGVLPGRRCVAGSLLAVCSCTIVPLFGGIYRKGAGIGPAITFLFFAPAGNIMALAYTGSILGAGVRIRALAAVPAVWHRHRLADGHAVLAR
jgi:uncharacterized protein